MATNKRFVAKNGLDNNSQTITNILNPVNAQDAATKNYVTNANNIISGTINVAILGSGTANSTTFLRGDNTWQTISVTGYAPIASPSFTGTVSTAGGLISLTNATSNLILFSQAGVGVPIITSRSVGTRIVWYPGLNAISADFATGISNITLWNSIPDNTHQFQWYGGTTLAATLTGAGNLTVTGGVSCTSITASAGLSCTSITSSGDIRTYRSGTPTTGVIYFSQASDKYLYYDGANFSLNGANIFTVTAQTSIDAKSFNSVVATGTAPITVTSTTQCTNLNANYLNGMIASSVSGLGSRVVASDGSGYIRNTYFNMTANDIGDVPISKVVVEITSDNFLRWQTPTNFTRRLNLGRAVNYLAMAQNGRLYSGPLWSFYYPQGYTTWYLPTVANTIFGDTIEIVSMHWTNNAGWQTTATLTIACDANVKIGTQVLGESLILDDARVQRITLTCNWVDGTNAAWSLS